MGGAEPIGVEVPDHIADPVLAREGHLGDRGHVHSLRTAAASARDARSPRPTAPVDDPHQLLSLVIVDLAYPQPSTHRARVQDQRLKGTQAGKPNLLRH